MVRYPSHRQCFSSDPIRFHAEALLVVNQIELGFGILVSRVLKRGSFTSLEELEGRILAFFDHFNRMMAKPFEWTYKGRPLKA